MILKVSLRKIRKKFKKIRGFPWSVFRIMKRQNQTKNQNKNQLKSLLKNQLKNQPKKNKKKNHKKNRKNPSRIQKIPNQTSDPKPNTHPNT